MQQSENIDQLMMAIWQMHAKHGVTIDADLKGHKAKYAGLPAILDAIRERCSEFDLVLIQPPLDQSSGDELITEVWHTKSNQWRRFYSRLPIKNSGNPDWDKATSTTYSRRYAAMGALGLCQDKDPHDNDGGQKNIQPIGRSEAKVDLISDKQLQFLVRTIGRQPNQQAALDHICNFYNIKSLSDIKRSNFNAILEGLGVQRLIV